MRKAFLFLLILGIGVAQTSGAAVYSNDEISKAINKLSNSAKRIEVENQRQQADYERQVFEYEQIMAKAERELELERINNPNARIGMTPIQVAYESNWGLPDSTNTQGKFELWIYNDGRYLYFINGKLTSIHD